MSEIQKQTLFVATVPKAFLREHFPPVRDARVGCNEVRGNYNVKRRRANPLEFTHRVSRV